MLQIITGHFLAVTLVLGGFVKSVLCCFDSVERYVLVGHFAAPEVTYIMSYLEIIKCYKLL